MYSFFNSFFKAGLPFGLIMGIFFSITYGWKIGLNSGLLSGFIFGFLIALFLKYQSGKFTKNRPLLPGEQLLKEGAANHFLDGEVVGGWIYLTNQRFYFKSHKSNIQNHELPIPLEAISSVEKANTFGIIPNNLRLTLQNGTTEKFVVNGAGEWAEIVKTLI